VDPSVDKLIADLDSFDPSTGDYMERLVKLTDEIRDCGADSALNYALYKLLEKHPDVDFGCPGPIVHTLETNGNYVAELPYSVARRPTYLNVWMVNRLLNSKLSTKDRNTWERVLQGVLINPRASDSVKNDVERFLEFQASKPDR
jgi:hypothetical protein